MTNKRMLFKMSAAELGKFLTETDFCALFCPEKDGSCASFNEECVHRAAHWLCDEAELESYR